MSRVEPANILVIAPHPDDEAIGCGGAIRLHVEQGDRVGVVFLTSGELGLKRLAPAQANAIRETESRAAAAILGHEIVSFLRLPDYDVGSHANRAADLLAPIITTWTPTQIYLPHPEESHPDHAVCLEIVARVMRAASIEAWLLGYEVWTPIGAPDNVQDISTVWPTKRKGIEAYPSQLAEFDYIQSSRGIAEYRGALFGKCAFAEAQITLG